MRKLDKKILATILASITITNVPVTWADEKENMYTKDKDVNIKYNYKNNKEEKSIYIKNYISKSSDADKVVNIPDANLKKGIYETLGKQDNETITKGELESITDLYISNSQITNLEGIQYCINLESLNLDNNNIKNVNILSKLINLEQLNLNDNEISDINPLSNISKLRYLGLSANNIKDISALSNMNGLVGLNLEYNNIGDISALSKATELESLTLYNNNIKDISALSDMINLEYLDLNNNEISDISPLSNLKIYRTLNLSNNNISDISPLANMDSLGCLLLDNNRISDISGLPISDLFSDLSLSNNNISDISSLAKREGLNRLNLENNNIEDISALSNLEYLSELNLNNNNISDISPLSKLERLNTLNLKNNKISDITSLSNLNYKSHQDIKYIDLTVNSIDLNDIKNKEAISHLEKQGYEVYYNGLNQLDAPVILVEDKIIMLNDEFDELSGVVAKDKDGVDITDNIKVIANEVWASWPGVYKIIYKVTDSKGISTTKEITVTVTKKIDGIALEKGNGTESNPVVALLQDEKATGELFNKLDNKFEYSLVGTPVIENNYKIYKLKLSNKARISNEDKYIELKVDLKNTNVINKLDNILVNSQSVTASKLIGDDRYKTAVEVSKKGWSKTDNVVIVNSSAIVDALSATPFAKMKDASILLTEKDKLNTETKKEIERLGAKNVYIIGGTGVVSENVVSQLKDMNLNIDRICGDTRYTTSLEIAKRLENISEIAVVNGVTGLADAVSIAPVAADRNMPIVLASPNEGTKTFDKFIKDNNIKTSYVIGGEAAISKDVASKLPNANRLGGLSRNETNAIILERFYTNKDLNNIFVAKDGMKKVDDLIDALAVGVLASKENSPLVIVGNNLDAKQEQLLKSKTPKEVTQVGGNGNENAFSQIVKMFKK